MKSPGRPTARRKDACVVPSRCIAGLLLALPLCGGNSLAGPPRTAAQAATTMAAACSIPNREATVTKVVRPEYPAGYGTRRRAVILVSIDAAGALVGSYVFRSSGIPAMDVAAREAARHSKYSPKLVNCAPVPGRYLFVAFFLTDGSPASAIDDLPPSASWANPFCKASAELVPWNLADRRYASAPSNAYALLVRAVAKKNYAARLTMIADDGVYQVDLPRTPVALGRPRLYFVAFEKGVSVQYYFVDGVGVDGQPIADCPSFVKPVLPAFDLTAEVTDFLVSDSDRVDAHYLQPLPALPCGTMYSAAKQERSYQPIVGHFGSRPLSTLLKVYLDSDGHVVDSEIERPSGVDGIDEAAFSAVQYATYRPATFLCTPVVSTSLITVQYEP